MKSATSLKVATVWAVVFAAITAVSMSAQQVDAHGDTNTYANAGGGAQGFGDDAASRSWEMISVNGELQGNVDSKTAKVGDRVVLKTTAKVQTSDGSIIPKGSRLVGRVTDVQAHNGDRAVAQLGIAFDHAELKNSQSIAIHSIIRTVRPSPGVMAMDTMSSDDTMGAPMGGGGMSGGRMGGGGAQPLVGAQPIAGGRGSGPLGTGSGPLGSAGSATNEAGNLGGPIDRTTNTAAGGLSDPVSARQDTAVQLAGHGDTGIEGGVHSAAAARATPHPTEIPGVMLAGSSSASGLFVASGRNEIQFTSGMQMQLGVVADR